MNRVTKVVPPRREILKDISLSFFPGAKIGVLGLNGAGKSTLLKIMAGLDTEIHGEARPQSGIRIGYLPQEPQLDSNKDVRGNVEEGISEVKSLLSRFDELSGRFAEPLDDAEMSKLLEEQARLQDAIEAADAWEIDRKLEMAADALRLPPWDSGVDHLSGGERRRVALCRLLLSAPDMLLLDEPTNHLDAESVAWLERFLHEYPGTVTTRPGWSRKSSAWSRNGARRAPIAVPSRQSSSGSRRTPRAGAPRARRGFHASRSWPRGSFKSEARPSSSIFRRGHGLASWWWKRWA
jgi:ATPase subunit of ABC transporter with duplicated ATPase domains